MITLSHVVRKRSTMRLPTSGGGTRPASAGVNSNPFLLLGRQEKGGLYFGSRRLETAIGAADAGRPAVMAELDRGEAGRGFLVEVDAEARLGGWPQVAVAHHRSAGEDLVRGVVVSVRLLVAEGGRGHVDGQVGGHTDGRDVARRVERGAHAQQFGERHQLAGGGEAADRRR